MKERPSVKWAGHSSGRGHGPGGRPWPMRGDRIEMLRPMTNNPPWDVVEVLAVATYERLNGGFECWVMVQGPGYRVPRYLDRIPDRWRWPHLTTLGIRGSVCCAEHGLIPAENLTSPSELL